MDVEIPEPTFIRCFQNHRLSINGLAFSPNSQCLASCSDDSSLVLWNLVDHKTSGADDQVESANSCFKYIGHKDAICSVALTDHFIVSGSKDCTARLWRINGGTDNRVWRDNITSESAVYRGHQSSINCVDINADGSQFCTASDDQTVKIWSCTATNKMIAALSGEHSNWVRHSRFSRLNHYLLGSCGDDGMICVWDTRTREAAIRLMSPKRRSTHFLNIQWHPTCQYLMSSASSDSLVRIWDLRYEKTLQFYQVHNGRVQSTDFHSSGNYLITASVDQTCKIIDLFEGRTLFTLRAHTGTVNCATFSSNGEYFATGGQDHVALLWRSNLNHGDSVDSGNLSDGEEEDIRSISFDPESKPLNDTFKDSGVRNRKPKGSPPLLQPSDDVPVRCEPITESENSAMTPEASLGILKCILQQLETMTDSILNIDQRLTTLEEQFQKRMSI